MACQDQKNPDQLPEEDTVGPEDSWNWEDIRNGPPDYYRRQKNIEDRQYSIRLHFSLSLHGSVWR